jgi:hypothetical protein
MKTRTTTVLCINNPNKGIRMKFLLIITIAAILGGCASSKTHSQNVRETELADRSPASLVQNSIDSTDDLYQQVAPTIQPTNLKRWITEDVPDKLWGDYTSEQLSGLSISVKYKRGTVPAQVTVEAAEWNNSEDHTGARKDYLTLGGIRLKSGRTSFTVGTQSEIGLHICRLVYAPLASRARFRMFT